MARILEGVVSIERLGTDNWQIAVTDADGVWHGLVDMMMDLDGQQVRVMVEIPPQRPYIAPGQVTTCPACGEESPYTGPCIEIEGRRARVRIWCDQCKATFSATLDCELR